MKRTLHSKFLLTMLAIISTFIVSCKKDPITPPSPKPVIPIISITVRSTPEAIAYGGTSKISATAENAGTITLSLNGVVLKTGTATAIYFETPSLLATTTYQVTATNSIGSTAKTADVTITVAPIHPKLKLLLDGKWQLVGEEIMKKWKGETSYTVFLPNPCAADDIYSFPTLTTCFAVWGPNSCAPDVESGNNKVYFGGFDTSKMILLWKQNDPWDVLEITDKKLRIHTLLRQLDDFTILSDYIQEYKNTLKNP